MMPSLHTYSPVYIGAYPMTATRHMGGATAYAVNQISLPQDARTLSTLARTDYEDAFAVIADVEHTAEQWVRAVVNDAPPRVRRRLWLGWIALGLRLGPPWSSHRVLGWQVKHRDDVLRSSRSELLARPPRPVAVPNRTRWSAVRDVPRADQPGRPRAVGRDHSPPPASRPLAPDTRRHPRDQSIDSRWLTPRARRRRAGG